MDKLFYIIYNSYYKHGKYKNDIPPLTVFGIFCIATFSVIIGIVYSFYLINDPTYFRTHKAPGKGIFFAVAVIITYASFYNNKRYKLIYNRFKDVSKYDSLTYRFIAFVIMFLFIISSMIFMLVYNKIYFGEWV